MSLRPLSKELQQIAINELNEDPDRVQADLKFIKEWACPKPHIRIKSDQWLVTFLRGCSFDLELAKTKLDLLFTLKPQVPEFFSNRDPFLPEIQEILKLGVCLPLRKSKDPAAARIILCRFEAVDPSKVRIETGMKLATMILDILQNEDDNVVVCGGHLLLDYKALTIKHALQVTPRLVKKIFRCFLDAYASRPRGCHVIKAPRIVHVGFNALKQFFNSEFLKIIYFYGGTNKNELYNTIPLSVLPTEYGGDGGTLEELTIEWKQKVESYRDWFLEEEQRHCGEADCPEEIEECLDFEGFGGMEFD